MCSYFQTSVLMMSIAKKVLKILSSITIALLFMAILFVAPIVFPNLFFNWTVSHANLTLSSDRYFDPEVGRNLLARVQSKLEKSSLYVPSQSHSIYIANSSWRQRLFFNYVYGVGGVNYFPLTSNVFLSGAIIEENKLISPSGNIVEGKRSLDYFAAHEISHTLLKQSVGILAHERLPEFVREGLPDFIAIGEEFDYSSALADFLNEVPEMDREGSGLYYRYHFLVAYLMLRKNWTEKDLLLSPLARNEVEREIKDEN